MDGQLPSFAAQYPHAFLSWVKPLCVSLAEKKNPSLHLSLWKPKRELQSLLPIGSQGKSDAGSGNQTLLFKGTSAFRRMPKLRITEKLLTVKTAQLGAWKEKIHVILSNSVCTNVWPRSVQSSRCLKYYPSLVDWLPNFYFLHFCRAWLFRFLLDMLPINCFSL